MNKTYCIDLYPGKTYYKAECGCIHLNIYLRKLKRPDLLNSRQPKINACPDHKSFVVERLVSCFDCNTITKYPPSGSVSCRCKPCALIDARKKQREKYLERHPKKGKKNVTPVKKENEIRFDRENMKVFRNPKAALTLEQAILRGVCCIPSDNLFIFNAIVRNGMI